MSNSSLVSYTKISPHKNSPRNHKIDTITIHCYVGQASVESMGSWFSNPAAKSSCNYGIGSDGRIALIVEEKDRSWCSSSSANDNRAITIECASDKTDPYAINDKVYASLIKLCVDICKRNEIKELKWKANKALVGHVDQQNMTVHRWFKNKACPGDYIYNRLGKIAKEVNEKLGAIKKPTVKDQNGIQASELKGLSEAQVVAKMGSAFTADQKKNGILASVSMAQFILESGYAKTELAQNANNCFGMKVKLSGNTWSGSTWDGKSKYTKNTQEYENGKYITISADFRKYPKIEDSIGDHSTYLLGAMNGDKKRYAGLKGCTDHKKAIQIIKDGGYATDPNYVFKILNIIERWNLKQYDYKETAIKEPVTEKPKTNNSYPEVPFTVKVLVDDLNIRTEASMNGKVVGQTGKGIFTVTMLSNDWGKLKSGAGWIYLGNSEYCEICDSVPFEVRVDITDLNIRTGAGTGYFKTGYYTGVGTFTIVDVKAGAGSDKGWGKLKSGAGWISLDYVTKL